MLYTNAETETETERQTSKRERQGGGAPPQLGVHLQTTVAAAVTAVTTAAAR